VVQTPAPPRPAPRDAQSSPSPRRERSTSVPALVAKILGLGLAIGLAAALTPTLMTGGRWGFLVAVWAVVAVLVLTYATGRGVPLKYLLPGTLFLILFLVYPIVMTAQVSTSNFGDGTRTSKEETISQIVGASVVQTPDAPRYNLTVATTGSATSGPFAFLLVEPSSGDAFVGTPDGLEPLDAGDVTITDGFVTEAGGYTLLTPREVNQAGEALADFAVPTEGGAIRQLGIRQAFEGTTTLEYDESSDTITNTQNGTTYSPQRTGDREFFVDEAGNRLSDQSWRANIGLDNYQRIITDPRISGDFLRIFVWTLVFATVSVVATFLLGLALAVTLNDKRLRGQRFYRSVLLLPYAIPGFIALLVWASFYNRDFGLINNTLGTNINWFGDPTWAKVAILITNLWMGFPYYFLVCTGALQAIPADLKEASSIDGASGFTGFRKITFPLLLVTVAPLLVSTFAYNFNNFNAIYLLTEGGPFDAANPTAGGTDILISYTYRLAFGAQGAQLGFAAAVSVLLFALTGVIAAIQFRFTRALEEVN
jgi:arabinogalactan oligomer / maltooligosaccharide transport system permease protein